MLERDIKNRIKRYLKKINSVKIVSYYAYIYGEPGTPDFIGCWDGKCILIEVKNEKGKLSPLQEQRIKEWKNVGAIVIVARSVDDIKNIIKGGD